MTLQKTLFYLSIKTFYKTVNRFPIDGSVRFCGILAKTLGPLTSVNKIGIKNLTEAFPELPDKERGKIMKDCWENLGHVVAEICHVDKILKDESRVLIKNKEKLNYGVKHGAFFLGAHLGNWEISRAPFVQQGVKINLLARVHENPKIEKFILKTRENETTKIIPRTARGAKELLRAVEKKECVGALVDQRAQDGVLIPFFNRSVKAPVSLARLAIKHDVPIIPVQISRVGKKTFFELTFHDPLKKPEEKNINKASILLMQDMYEHIESWIKKDPAQWLWLHNRWKDSPT